MKQTSPYPKIDALKKKFNNNKPLSLREVCFVLWAELGACSSQYLSFAYWIKENKLSKQKLKWPLWKSLFDSFAENEWPNVRSNTDHMLKIQKLGTNIINGKARV